MGNYHMGLLKGIRGVETIARMTSVSCIPCMIDTDSLLKHMKHSTPDDRSTMHPLHYRHRHPFAAFDARGAGNDCI